MKSDGMGDWRIKAVTTLAKDVPAAYPGGPSHKAGALVYLISSTKATDGQSINFITPSPAALALNIASNAAKQAIHLRQTLAFKDMIGPDGHSKGVADENHPHLYDFFEFCMLAITFSFQALETFSNDTIVNSIKDTYPLKKNGITKNVTAYELQRNTSTEYKLSVILPDILKIASPTTDPIWSDFNKLKDSRDAVIHLKPSYVATEDMQTEIIFCQFVEDDIAQFPKCAFRLIEHFLPPNKLPRWFILAKEMHLDE